jgi:mannose-1-phosphate guanylyltransferase
MKKYIVIMAGGIGTRFWPSSTEDRPKQFLDILGMGKSLLRMTYERSLKIAAKEEVIVMTNKKYYTLVKQELPELPEENILCEPSRNDTAPCIAYAALHINARNEEASFAVLSSDHLILYEDKFVALLHHAFDYCADNDSIVTLGIKPFRPDTGYGYIHFSNTKDEVKKVIGFKEKPDAATAQQYIESGQYVWNAGIFVWSNRSLIRAFKKHAPNIISTLNENPGKFNTYEEQDYIDEVYPLTDKISIDYAIMEKADNIYTIEADIGWSDLGTWASLYDYADKGDNGNVIQSDCTVTIDTYNSIIKAKDGKKILVKGLTDFIVIDEDHALLIFPKNNEQEIKEELKKFDNLKTKLVND